MPDPALPVAHSTYGRIGSARRTAWRLRGSAREEAHSAEPSNGRLSAKGGSEQPPQTSTRIHTERARFGLTGTEGCMQSPSPHTSLPARVPLRAADVFLVALQQSRNLNLETTNFRAGGMKPASLPCQHASCACVGWSCRRLPAIRHKTYAAEAILIRRPARHPPAVRFSPCRRPPQAFRRDHHVCCVHARRGERFSLCPRHTLPVIVRLQQAPCCRRLIRLRTDRRMSWCLSQPKSKPA
jgi:hypothetical protein